MQTRPSLQILKPPPCQRRRHCAASLIVLAAGMMLAASPGRARAADPNEFIVWSHPNLPGRMYVPANYGDGGNHPFILFLHGLGERGTDNVAQLNSNIDGLFDAARQRGAFLYAPQSPTATWGSAAATPTLAVQRAVAMMRAAQSAYPGIDDNRLYATGISAGGGGAWDTLASYPRTFAAGAPICGTLGPAVYRESLEDENIWTVHARNDTVVPVSTTRDMVNAIFTGDGFPPATFPPLGSAGDAYYAHGQLQYLEPGAGDHQIWEVVYRKPEFYGWMFAQVLPEPTGAAAMLLGAPAMWRRRRRACG